MTSRHLPPDVSLRRNSVQYGNCLSLWSHLVPRHRQRTRSQHSNCIVHVETLFPPPPPCGCCCCCNVQLTRLYRLTAQMPHDCLSKTSILNDTTTMTRGQSHRRGCSSDPSIQELPFTSATYFARARWADNNQCLYVSLQRFFFAASISPIPLVVDSTKLRVCEILLLDTSELDQ